MKTILTVIVGIILIVIIGYWTKQASNKPIKASSRPATGRIAYADPNYVQNVYEAQERLKTQGFYHGKIDGKWGKLTDKAYCDWSAVQEFRRVEE
jgi:hypothetical protein